MLDVHPPHAPTHSWKDFFIHVGTICIGLLIAVGLEQSVEAIHRHHQRETLEAELHQEALENQHIAAGDLLWMNWQLIWLLDVKAAVDAVRDSHGKVKAMAPPHPPLAAGALEDTDLNLTAWNSARQSARLDLLSSEDANLYSRNYSMAEQVLRQDVFTIRQVDLVFSYLVDRGSSESQFELSRLSDPQLEDLSHAVATLFTYLHEQKNAMLLFVAASECLQKHESDRERKLAILKAATAQYADPRIDGQAPIFWKY